MRNNTPFRLQAALLAGIVLCAVFSAYFATSFSQGANNRNVSVDTRVNVTQSMPEVLNVTIEGGAANITLNAGAGRLATCNVSARDYNGGSTLTANATLFHSSVLESAANDNNTHYTNGSCAVTATDGFYRNFSCGFVVQYYATFGTWNCTANVTDDYGFSARGSDGVHVDQLLALNVTTLIDYGDLAVGDTSDPQQANITNLGNIQINVSVKGYGLTLDDGLAFDCEVGNISIEHEKYNTSDGGQALGAYFNLSSTLTQVPGLVVAQRTIDNQSELNATYWITYIPPNPFGLCNGTVIFQAQNSA